MAWRNLGRNRRRTAINLSAIAFATITMVFMSSMQKGSYDEMIEAAVKMQTGHLQVQADGYVVDNDIQLTVENVSAAYDVLDSQPGVVGAVARVQTGFLIAKGEDSFVAIVMGTDAERETKVSNWPKWVRKGEFLSTADPNGVVVGEKLANNLDAALGAELVLVGQALDGSIAATKVTVRGIIRTGLPDLDRMAVMMNLAPLQQIMAMDNRASIISVLLEGHEIIPPVQAALQQRFDQLDPTMRVLNWKQVEPGLDQGIQMDNISGKIMVYMLLLVVAFGILNTILMSAFERFREFGTLMAIGVRPRTCAGLLLLESQLLAVVGFFIGLVIGGALTIYFSRVGIPIPGAEEYMAQFGMGDRMYPVVEAGIAWFVFLQVWLTTSVVALYPAWKITRFRPLEAIRYQ